MIRGSKSGYDNVHDITKNLMRRRNSLKTKEATHTGIDETVRKK